MREHDGAYFGSSQFRRGKLSSFRGFRKQCDRQLSIKRSKLTRYLPDHTLSVGIVLSLFRFLPPVLYLIQLGNMVYTVSQQYFALSTRYFSQFGTGPPKIAQKNGYFDSKITSDLRYRQRFLCLTRKQRICVYPNTGYKSNYGNCFLGSAFCQRNLYMSALPSGIPQLWPETSQLWGSICPLLAYKFMVWAW